VLLAGFFLVSLARFSEGLAATTDSLDQPFLSCRSGLSVILSLVLAFPLVSRLHASSVLIGFPGKPF